MFKEIPYYGKNSIKKIKSEGNSRYEIERYDGVDNTKLEVVYATDKNIINDYTNTIKEYLENKKEAYLLAKDIIGNNTIVKRCKKIMAISSILALGIPILGFITSSLPIIVIGGIAFIIYIPAFSYTFSELKYKNDTNTIKKHILEYEDLKLELDRVLEKDKAVPTKFSSIRPISYDKEEEKEKRRVRGK